ncbi:unnamed protein product [Mesocestoides corti]|uniref:receptor protein serine/threonine kinase n=1 Tax=Mesocestoides corti TaxID=53468 RepID=A0A0R3UGJ6_MESCO|nr:unnamed protein product [Mesocestoides corti]
MKSSSAASTNSTNLQESQSCCSSQLVPDKSFCGQQLIHKLEILTVQSLNRHYEQLSDMEGTRGRPALAHRNLCLENAFLKPDGSSCLGGLEYAVCPPPTPLPVPIPQLLQMFAAHVQEWSFDASPPTQTAGDFSSDRCPSDKADCHPTEGTPTPVLVTKPPFPDWWPVCGLKVGDPICTAPELLEEKIFPFCFESHKRADIYALGVVMWEILAWAMGSAIGRPKSNEAQPPGGWVPHQSGLAAMRQMACLRQPNLLVLDAPKLDPITDRNDLEAQSQSVDRPNWSQVCEFFAKLLPECWNRCPEKRLSALRIKKNLAKFSEGFLVKDKASDAGLSR